MVPPPLATTTKGQSTITTYTTPINNSLGSPGQHQLAIPTPTLLGQPPKTNSHPPLLSPPPLPVRRLSPTELHEKRPKGICYNCDQKWTMGHRCRSQYLLLLGTANDELEDSPGDEQLTTSELEVVTPVEVVTGDISSLNTLAGQGNPRSLRLMGEITGRRVQVLIDNGSTHNFVKPTIPDTLGLNVKKHGTVSGLHR